VPAVEDESHHFTGCKYEEAAEKVRLPETIDDQIELTHHRRFAPAPELTVSAIVEVAGVAASEGVRCYDGR